MEIVIILGITAIALYLGAAAQLAVSMFGASDSAERAKQRLISIGFLGLLTHAVILYQGMASSGGLNFSFFSAASLVAWMIVLVLLVASMSRPLENLALFLLPMAALAIALELVLPGDHLFSASTPVGLQIHILLSIIAYSVLTVAALQAVGLAIQDRQLRNKHPGAILRALPPLQVMEVLLFQFIGLGFFLLSLSLVSGMVFLDNMFAQHLVHKTVLSFLAWFIFATLLWGRWRFGWRGKTAIRWTIGGFTMLMLAYFGSKLVLELILGR